ncbi:HlyD family efflux transporter periplasmic adaptor subunit [Chelatococcus sp. SYSU_G07232]|uniref:HlyD family efflux transporter periplasmic adaptor subunit n=1 Tax=Chelatococcus albus TaxID=3047466 RepID=A0ABT7AG96_9HYPH|nr:HlyD family efflux transporter periplasmic adaptor subunit [Chelatococcus sp. SYSU_G07232]MDJ1158384.1 HlyD family efflux transporter periplasmic adaptor subunit [Chelatococcus sp. SYSU_G07232]
MNVARLLRLLVLTGGLLGCQESGQSVFQGYVEANLVFVGPDDPGRLVALSVAEGDRVEQGQILFSVDDTLELAARDQAKAALAEARARLERLQAAQKRPQEIEVLRATEARARVALELSQTELERQQKLYAQGNTSKANLETAQATRDQNRAALEEVQRQIVVGELASHELDIAAARQAVDVAEGQLVAAEQRLSRRTLAAPAAGTVEQVYFRPGEVVPAGRPAVALLPPANLKVRFFVPQALLPRIAPGGVVSVTCDGCAGGLTARISFIAREAEYTPPVIYSLEERAKLVFMIEARPDEPTKFRVGQPVSVMLVEGRGQEASDGLSR